MAKSSACVPLSDILPLSKTTILSQRSSEDRRWLITIFVTFCNSGESNRFAFSRPSVRLSTAERVSSRSSSFGAP